MFTMPRRILSGLHVAAAMACTFTAAAQSGATQAPASAAANVPPPVCAAAEHRQFDFWLGEWEVWGGPQLDRIVGRNTIASVASGCALREHWINSGGRDGHSLNVYDRQTQRWTQFWIGSDGVVLRLEGSRQGDAMVMTGALPGANGGVQRQRIAWTPQPDGSVEQRWETSDDDGKTWQIAFVGLYRRQASAAQK